MTKKKTMALTALLGGVVALGVLTPALARKASKTITLGFHRLYIGDEDDPLSNDEPYVIITKVRMKVSLTGGKPQVVPGTLQVSNMRGSQNDLGRSGDNWGDEPESYNLNLESVVRETVPDEPGWMVGMVVTFMEEDAFSEGAARTLANKVRDTVEKAAKSFEFSSSDTKAIQEAVKRKIERDMKNSAGGFFQGIASAVDPDDYGGVKVVLAATVPGNKVMFYSGEPPASPTELLTEARPIQGSGDFSLGFPSPGLGSIPDRAEYKGKCRFFGKVRVQ